MKQIIKFTSLFLTIVAVSFAAGILVAELQLRFLNPASKRIMEINSFNQSQSKTDEISAEEEAKQADAPKLEEDSDAVLTVPDTLPNSVSKFSFAILGDTQRFDSNNAGGGFQQAVKNITAKSPDFVMTEGDLLSSCSGGCEGKFAVWKNILGPLASKTYEVVGNHDRTGGNSSDSAWQKAFNLPTNGPAGYSELVYSFDFQNSHFVVLNSEKPEEHIINKAQRNWLEADLAADKKENTFVFFHEPAYPVSSKIKESLDAEKSERDALWNILAKYKVTAVFNGHEHIHSRKKIGGIYQFVFGNTDSFDHDLPKPGGADFSHQGRSFGIVEVAGKQITVNLYSVDGHLINSFKFP